MVRGAHAEAERIVRGVHVASGFVPQARDTRPRAAGGVDDHVDEPEAEPFELRAEQRAVGQMPAMSQSLWTWYAASRR